MLNILFWWEEGWHISEKGKIERREAWFINWRNKSLPRKLWHFSIKPLKTKFWKLIIFRSKLFTSWFRLYRAKKSQNFEFLYFGLRNIEWQIKFPMTDSGVKRWKLNLVQISFYWKLLLLQLMFTRFTHLTSPKKKIRLRGCRFSGTTEDWKC